MLSTNIYAFFKSNKYKGLFKNSYSFNNTEFNFCREIPYFILTRDEKKFENESITHWNIVLMGLIIVYNDTSQIIQ